ncbi:MAG: hypothetical protein DI629_03590 [Mesorhizobium amorphae]|nr:MAG: hypothetical protein DI629_03590 [Mesorhizobium amorphae]
MNAATSPRRETLEDIQSAARMALDELATPLRRRLAEALDARGALTPQALFQAEARLLIGSALDAYTEAFTAGCGASDIPDVFADQVAAIAREQAVITLAVWDVFNGAQQP